MINIKYLRGIIVIAIGTLSPLSAWAAGEASAKAAILMGAIGALTSTLNWLDQVFGAAPAPVASSIPSESSSEMPCDVKHDVSAKVDVTTNIHEDEHKSV